MQVPKLVNHDGTLTADGQKVVNFVEANIRDMDGMNADQLNGKAGVFRYAFSRTKINGASVAQLLAEQEFNFGQNAWGLMHYAEEKAAEKQQIAETADKTSTLAEALEELKAAFEVQAAELKALKEAQPPAEKPAKTKSKTKDEPAADETPDDESEAE